MNKLKEKTYCTALEVFRGLHLPEAATPVGYAALIEAYDLQVPLPRSLFAIGAHHRVVETQRWTLLTPRHAPAATLEGHLTFALKNEGVDLAVLKRLFSQVDATAIEDIVRRTPTGGYARRIWFFYEWLTAQTLALPDARTGGYVPAIDPAMQYAVGTTNSPRHRVQDNLPGTPAFCPLVFRTDTLDAYAALDLPARAREIADQIPAELFARTAAFLLLKDSRSSYAIEGEHPAQDRMQRWGRAIGQAGRVPLQPRELLRLQALVIGDARFVRLGLRDDHGFVGEHEPLSQTPIPAHISAQPGDLEDLVEGLCVYARDTAPKLDPIVAAACVAFGFVYIHPFQDGNGRIHRYLIHHVLSRHRFHPPGLIFPISSAILARIRAYEETLESYSERLLPLIDWRARPDGNVDVRGDTVDFYRFFDATPHAEFLYACAQKIVDEDLPSETEFLRRHDQFQRRVELLVDMPDATRDLLFRFLNQNRGQLSKRARTREFSALTVDEIAKIETIYAELFAPEDGFS